MALPVGVITATVTAGTPITFTGANLQTNITVTPSADLVHIATGTPLVAMMEQTNAAEGVQAQIVLPVTDQDGFQDSAGNAYKNWYYTVTIQYSTNGRTVPARTKVFQLVTGQEVVDIDLLPSGNAAIPVTAPVATVSSVNGQTGAVTVEGATDAAVATQITSGEQTAAALNATYAPANAELTITRNSAGMVTGVIENAVTETYTRDTAGRVATITRAGVTKTILRDLAGRATGAI